MPPPASTPARTGAVPIATVDGLLATPEALVVDLRSPAEFAEDHVPGAHNVPLFDDVERGLVGLLYRQFSPAAGFAEGRAVATGRIQGLACEIGRLAGWQVTAGDLESRVAAMTSEGLPKLEASLEPFTPEALPDRPVVLHCWRGGLRSRSVVALLRAVGLERAVGLDGGYKAYRRRVLADLERWSAPPAYVLRGLTGVGKTLVLRELEALRPGWTFDLEALAGHRSSLLGMVGLDPCSQRTFESRNWGRVRAGFPGPVVFEGESRKVGDAVVPAAVWAALRGGTNLELVAPVERRVAVLLEDYLASAANRPRLREQLAAIEERLPEPLHLVRLFDARREPELVELLLEHYYDPLYRRSEEGNVYAERVDCSDPARAAARIAGWIEARPDRA